MQGYGDLHAYNVAEAIYVVLYMFVSIGVAAYFVGTSVLLVVENEKKTGAYRCGLQRNTAGGAAQVAKGRRWIVWHCESAYPACCTEMAVLLFVRSAPALQPNRPAFSCEVAAAECMPIYGKRGQEHKEHLPQIIASVHAQSTTPIPRAFCLSLLL